MSSSNGFLTSQYNGYVTTPNGVITPMPYGLGVMAGLVPGHTNVNALGFNGSVPGTVSTTAGVDIWSGQGLYPFQTSAQSLEILSDSANDTAAGTGARTIMLTLLDANLNPTTKIVTLNGTTPVAVPGGPYLRVNLCLVNTAGTFGGGNIGNVTLRVASGGATQSKILPQAGIAQSSIYTVPTGFSLFVSSIVYLINNSSASGAWVNIVTNIQNSARTLQGLQISNQDIDPYRHDLPFPLKIAAGTDFMLRAVGSSGTQAVTASWSGVVIDNNFLN